MCIRDRFSTLKNTDNRISTDFSWSGWAIYNSIGEFKRTVPEITVWPFVIMPDHVHIILFANRRLEKHLGRYVSDLKTRCTQMFQRKSLVYGYTQESIFLPGFNDRILYGDNQLERWTNYIRDNPRRLFIMRSSPDFFTKANIFQSSILPSHLWLPGQEPLVQTLGNRLLLEYPELHVVKFSSSFSPEEWRQKKTIALQVAKNSGVLVSPFIHKEEKYILEEGLRLGAKVIKIVPDGFLEREKPQGADFYHCAEGRMLLAAMNAGAYSKTKPTRELCQRMNKLAVWVSEHAQLLL